ncbi:LysE family translocator [Vibrio hannami]|uniref:LysE family translocator n=1 Tax=Vibrio hannami TaxID=2717094 RepID=UPI00240F7175|nr:LysE family translocator [Vibrio hannami]MDG3088173.1 LysE family translocator [Vibrio hannami]
MIIQNFEAFLIAITVLTLTPGLDTALVIKNTSRAGVKDGFVTSLGICCGLFVHALLSAIGVSAILLQSAELFQALKLVGAAYLIWLGIGGVKSLFTKGEKLEVGTRNTQSFRAKRSFREGFLSNVLNPKTGVFYLAFLPQFINPEYSPFIQSMLLAAIHFVIAMIWQCSLSGALHSAKRLLSSPKFLSRMEGITGSVLILLGLKLIVDEVELY